MNFIIPLTFLVVVLSSICESKADDDLLVVSVATRRTDGFKRYIRSLNVYGYSYEIFGLDEEWKGGDVKKYAGGGHKVNILLRELEKYKDDEKKVLLFTDSYDVIIDDEPAVVHRKFRELNARIVFGAEAFCWPDQKLADQYPEVDKTEKRFLNSGGIIGYASDFYKLISTAERIKDEDDDQLFYTKLFLNQDLREQFQMKLDIRSDIFLNLNGALADIYFKPTGHFSRIYNNLTDALPSVIHGNGATKLSLNHIGNYIAEAYSSVDGCLACNDELIKLEADETKYPTVTLGIFVERQVPFLREFFEKIANLNYPKNKISVLLHNNAKYHTEEIAKFFEAHKAEYVSVKYISPEEDSQEYEARTEAIEECKRNKCGFYFAIDATAHLDNANTLKILIEQNRPVLAPVMVRKYTQWSNFWGAISESGFYARSPNYVDIIEYKQVGVWNVPFVNEAVLMKGDFINNNPVVYEDSQLDSDMAFARNLRDQDVFMYATNLYSFGHLINPDTFNTSLTRPEMYEIFSNFDDWESRYIRPDYYTQLEASYKVDQPCPDVYWFPIVTEEFCKSLIDMMETFGQWSGGKNYDPRLPGAYENVPTVDIHMKQVGWESHWLLFLRKFVQPIQQKIFTGYFHDPPDAQLNFVVRYNPSEQDHLRPHHDASTYTINIALNKPGIDFQGGGCRFVRYNCSVLDTRVGWSFIHPGRLTHYHEGLKVTNGTRYIMVSFIDP